MDKPNHTPRQPEPPKLNPVSARLASLSSSGPRQLLNPHQRQRAGLAEATPAVPPAPHPDPIVVVNQLERWFRDLTGKDLRRGIFTQRARPDRQHPDLCRHHQHQPQHRPMTYTWTATAESILAKIADAATPAGSLPWPQWVHTARCWLDC